MANKRVSVWYDDEGDMLEVLWAFREGYFTPTDDDRISSGWTTTARSSGSSSTS